MLDGESAREEKSIVDKFFKIEEEEIEIEEEIEESKLRNQERERDQREQRERDRVDRDGGRGVAEAAVAEVGTETEATGMAAIFAPGEARGTEKMIDSGTATTTVTTFAAGREQLRKLIEFEMYDSMIPMDLNDPFPKVCMSAPNGGVYLSVKSSPPIYAT